MSRSGWPPSALPAAEDPLSGLSLAQLADIPIDPEPALPARRPGAGKRRRITGLLLALVCIRQSRACGVFGRS
ncbi:hypothetical protein [Arenibaculum pallidiluteum]|uniref:hypothetical protein n=1 Tax=Arenibaculum pallidiluteum TaxID=2812559 RepID=UPI001A95B1BA|nr:hypothetical protein [Arenibaculum pallidiluteum]